jgi:hypothetical protein
VVAVTVGKAPPTVPLMRRPDISRPKDAVAPGISPRHQVPDDDMPATGSDAGGVFQEHPGRSHGIDCPNDLSVEPAALPGDADASAGGADVLARESAAHRINRSQSAKVHPAHIALDDMQSREAGA